MNIPPQFAYLFLTAGFGIVWIFFFIRFPKTRKTQLIISALSIPLGPIIEILYFQDYWHPLSVLEFNLGPFRILIEDIAFVFFFTGLTGMLAHISGKRAKNLDLKIPLGFLIGVGLISILIALPLFYFGLNSILATSAGFLAIATIAAITKRQTLRYSVRCGLLTALTMFAVYFIQFHIVSNSEEMIRSTWLLYDKPVLGIRIAKVPLTELVWGFSWGTMMGAVRHYIFG